MQLEFPTPAARTTDPQTSHEAGRTARKAAERLRKEIRAWFAHNQPASQAECADALSQRGWDWRTVVSACNPKRSGLEAVAKARHLDENGEPYGCPFNLYAIPTETVETDLV